MIRRVANFGLVVLLAPFFFAFAYEGAKYVASVFTLEATKWFLLGAALALPFSILILNNDVVFIEHLVHELEHAVMAFIFSGRWPTRMEIDPEKGSKVTVSTGGGCILTVVTLAPYGFAMFTVPFLVIKALIDLVFHFLEGPVPVYVDVVFDLLIGASLMFHYVFALKQFRFSQPDIKKTGWVASLVSVLFLNFMFLVVSMAVVTGTYAQFWEYLKSAVAMTVDAYKAAWDFLVTRILPFLSGLLQSIIQLFCPDCTPTPAP
jgi:hypothetical protein